MFFYCFQLGGIKPSPLGDSFINFVIYCWNDRL